MTFKYYAIVKGEVVDKSNSLTSLKIEWTNMSILCQTIWITFILLQEKESINRKIL